MDKGSTSHLNTLKMSTNGGILGLDLEERSNLVELDRQLHAHWSLGRNFILGWCPHDQGVLLLVVPHYAVASYALPDESGASDPGSPSQTFIMDLLSRRRQIDHRRLENAAKLFHVDPTYIPLRKPLSNGQTDLDIIEQLVRRYSINYIPNRAVALFDIVGFSLLTPFEQMTQLNSLSYSLNSAHHKMVGTNIDVNFARSSTGDGFYIWNRDNGMQANSNLYHLMHLVMADNAIARRRAKGRTVPLLRTCFHVGGCYEFHQAEGLNPTIRSDIVGDVTIELARMIEQALPGQIFVGEFETLMLETGSSDEVLVDSIRFVDIAQKDLSELSGLELSGEAIDSIKCYLTGQQQDSGRYSIRKLSITDKHGLTRNVFNAKINIYRRDAEPILLGIEDKMLSDGSLDMKTVTQIIQD
jgi:hypothetical protein